MSKLAFIGAACVAAFALSGCSELDKAATFVDQPNVQQALATIKTVNRALVCDVAAGSSLAKSIESQVGAHTGVAGQIDVVSSTVCAVLGGTLTGATESNAAAVSAVAQ